jgi:ABC-type iron transport system FetAB permease component
MLGTLATLVPLGLAMTFSTVPISLTILVLLSPQRSRTAVPYLVGWVFGIAFFAVVLTAGILVAAPAPWAQERLVVPWAEIALGLGLIAYAVVGAWRKRTRAPSSEAPRWVGLALALKPGRAFLLAFALSLRPKSLLLTTAAGLVIVSRPMEGLWVVVALALFTIVSSSSVAGTILYTLLSPSRANTALSAVHRWLVTNGALLSRVVALGTGIVLAGRGAWQL